MKEQTQTQAVALTLGSSAVRGTVRGSDRQVGFQCDVKAECPPWNCVPTRLLKCRAAAPRALECRAVPASLVLSLCDPGSATLLL